MTILDSAFKLITLIRMFDVAPQLPSADDDLLTYINRLRRQLCALAIARGAQGTLDALARFRAIIRILGPKAAAEPLPPCLLRMLRSEYESAPRGANDS